MHRRYLPTPQGSQPIAGGRAQRKPPVHVPSGSCIPEGYQPMRCDSDTQGCNPFGIDWLVSPLTGGDAALTTGYWLKSLRDKACLAR